MNSAFRLLADDDVNDETVALVAQTAAAGERTAFPPRLASLAELRRHRVASLFTFKDDQQGDGNKKRRHEAARVQLMLLGAVVSILRSLGPIGDETRILKGLATMQLDYADQTLRQTGDVDLLVREHHLDEVVSKLRADGCRPHDIHISVDQSFRKGLTLIHPTGVEIDLHTRMNRYNRPLPDLLFERPAELPHGGLALPVDLRLLHAASHFVLTPPGLRRLSGFADISSIRSVHQVDLDHCRHLASRLGIEGIAAAVLRSEASYRSTSIRDLSNWASPSALERQSFVRKTRRLPMEHVYAASRLHSAGERFRYLRSWGVPSDRAASSRGGRSAYYRKLLGRGPAR